MIVLSLNSHDLWQDADVPMEEVLVLFAICCLCEKGTSSGTFSAVLYNLLVMWFSGRGRGHCAVPSICPNEWRCVRLSCVHFPPWRNSLMWAISGYARYKKLNMWTQQQQHICKWVISYKIYTLQATNISPKNGILKMMFLFARWDMLVLWRVISLCTKKRGYANWSLCQGLCESDLRIAFESPTGAETSGWDSAGEAGQIQHVKIFEIP